MNAQFKRGSVLEWYVYTTWACIILALVLGLLGNVLRLPVLIFGLPLAIWAATPRQFLQGRIQKPHPIILWVFAAVAVLEGISVFGMKQDTVGLAGGVLLGILPVFYYRGRKVLGIWLGFLTLQLIAIVSVVAMNSLREYFLFLVFLGISVFNLNLMHVFHTSKASLPRMEIPVNYFSGMVTSLLFGCVAGAFIFLALPRIPQFSNPFGIREKGVSSGYTGSINLKVESDISASSELALVVEARDTDWLSRHGEGMYLRGNTLDYFDGTNWTQSALEYAPLKDPHTIQTSPYLSPAQRYFKIYREPHRNRHVIYPGVFLSIEAPTQIIGELFYDANRNLLRGSTDLLRYSYDVISGEAIRPFHYEKTKLETLTKQNSALSPAEQMRYLQAPFDLKSRNFFSEWVAEVGAKPTDTVPQAIQRLRAHFFDNFTPMLSYSLSSSRALESFLTRDRKGHCEFFATAAVLYFRALGLPSRIVLGYHGGTFNKVSKVLEVREQHAHAWSEVYVPSVGWVDFDPTPMAPVVQMTQLEALTTFYLGAMKFWANRYLVNYNAVTQKNLVRSFSNVSKWRDFKKLISELWWSPLPLVLFVAAMIGGVLVFRAGRRIRRRRKETPRYYLLWIKKLKSLGVRRGLAESHLAFSKRVISAGIAVDLAQQIYRALERDYYSMHPLEPAEQFRLLTLVRNF